MKSVFPIFLLLIFFYLDTDNKDLPTFIEKPPTADLELNIHSSMSQHQVPSYLRPSYENLYQDSYVFSNHNWAFKWFTISKLWTILIYSCRWIFKNSPSDQDFPAVIYRSDHVNHPDRDDSGNIHCNSQHLHSKAKERWMNKKSISKHLSTEFVPFHTHNTLGTVINNQVSKISSDSEMLVEEPPTHTSVFQEILNDLESDILFKKHIFLLTYRSCPNHLLLKIFQMMINLLMRLSMLKLSKLQYH